jgi:hypothetical protein
VAAFSDGEGHTVFVVAGGAPGVRGLPVGQGGASRHLPKQRVDEGALDWGLATVFCRR